MMKFPIPPEYCLIVNAFSQATTLRHAAILLQTDPAGLVRKVQKISSEFGFLQKVGNRWVVTDSGRQIAHWSEEVIASQNELIKQKPRYRLAAFSWLCETMLVPNFKKLEKICGHNANWLFKMTASDLESELIHNRSDFVLTGHAPNDPLVAHKKIVSYHWVVIVPSAWKKNVQNLSPEHLIAYLNSMPFIRHSGLSPAQILDFVPEKFSNLILDGVIGLRSAVASELGWSAIPAMSIYDKDRIHIVKLPTNIKDDLSIWWLRARKDSAAQVKYLSQWVNEFKL